MQLRTTPAEKEYKEKEYKEKVNERRRLAYEEK
jgi:hypothetical protein